MPGDSSHPKTMGGRTSLTRSFYRETLYAQPMTRQLGWLVLAVVALTGCAQARVTFLNATPSAPLAIPAETYKPGGSGPFPAVVLLHGCEGVSENSRRWAQWLTEQGYVAVVVDSWTPRGLKETCTFTVEDPPNTARFDDAIGA